MTQWKKYIPQLVAVAILVGLVYLVAQQASRWGFQTWDSIRIAAPAWLAVVIVLAILNWGMEYWKWRAVLRATGFTTEFPQRLQSFLAGISSGFVTPNFLGNFIGRIYYFPRMQRPYILVFTLFANAAQFFASVLFGLCAWWWVGTKPTALPPLPEGVLWLSTGIIVLMLWMYLRLAKVPFSSRKWQKFKRFLAPSRGLRLQLLVLSLARHLVFSGQYVLLLHAFGVDVDGTTWFWVWQVFFWSTWTPSLWFGKLVVRESFALLILAPVYGHPETILLVSITLWLINQALPAFVGWFGWFQILKKR